VGSCERTPPQEPSGNVRGPVLSHAAKRGPCRIAYGVRIRSDFLNLLKLVVFSVATEVVIAVLAEALQASEGLAVPAVAAARLAARGMSVTDEQVEQVYAQHGLEAGKKALLQFERVADVAAPRHDGRGPAVSRPGEAGEMIHSPKGGFFAIQESDEARSRASFRTCLAGR
jgi:hypothetical protein